MRYIIFLKVIIFLFLSTVAHGAIVITNPGNGDGTIKWRATTGGVVLESCTLSPASACNVGVSQDTVNGNVLEAESASGSYFSGWSGAAGSVGACNDLTRLCYITGSSAGPGNAVNARFDTCTFTPFPTNSSFPWSGGAGNIIVTAAHSSCSWTATENLEWVAITSGMSGTGSATVSYSVSVNRNKSRRTGTISIGGANFTVTQEAYIGGIIVDPEPVDFGTVKMGVPSQLDLNISNIGTTSLNISSVEITGTNGEEFSMIGSCLSIAAGNSCTIKVLLIPQSAGNKTATLTINSDDPASPVYEVTLNGTASTTAEANISVSPSELIIYDIDIEIGANRNIRINNTGTGSLIIHSINVTGISDVEFSVNNRCTVIHPGNYCDFGVTGSFSSNTPKKASIVISSNAQNASRIEIPIDASSDRCSGSMALSSTSVTAPYEGIGGAIEVTKTGGSQCVWAARDTCPWISVNYSGNTINYTVSPNTSNSLRIGTINAAGHPFTVIQHGSANNITFNDIEGNYFADYINAIYSRGITVGCVLNTSYCPNAYVTRGQMAAFIIRALYGEDFYYTKTPYFNDVPENHTFFKYVQRLKDDGITVVTGTYRIDDYVTRGQMAAFIIRALYGEEFDYTPTPYFNDVPSSHVFFEYVQKMKDTGITIVSDIYEIDSYVTREQMAAFLGRAFLGMG